MALSVLGTTGAQFRLNSLGPSRSCPPAEQRGLRLSTTLTTSDAADLTAGDRCDRCNAQGRVRAIMPRGGDLIFCNHHAKLYDERLRRVAVRIIQASGSSDSWAYDR